MDEGGIALAAFSIDAAEVREICDIAYEMKRMTLVAADIARAALPGQFVMVATEASGTILRRPLGISGADSEAGLLTLRFAVVGKGTRWLAARRKADTVSLSGPFGRGFSKGAGERLLIGGGTGIAPLLFLKDEILREGGKATLVVGAKDGACLMENDMLAKECIIATEDGSLGEKGFVTGPLLSLISRQSFDSASACGPIPMLKAVKAMMDGAGIPLEISLEAHMGCGTGACNGCTCTQAAKQERWQKVCKDGPVFPSQEVLL